MVLHLDGTIAVNRDIRVAVALLSQQLCAVRGLPFKMGMDHTDDLAFLQDCVVRMGAAGETVLFLVEGLEAYAPKHARQTLLYTLLNLTHLQSVRMCAVQCSRERVRAVIHALAWGGAPSSRANEEITIIHHPPFSILHPP